MKKIFRVLLFLFAIAVIFSGTASAYEATSKTVQFSLNGNPVQSIKTYASTVEEFFKEQNIEIGPADKVTPEINCKIYNGLIISYKSYYEITLVVDGIYKNVPVERTTVGSVIESYSKSTGIDYDYNKSLKDFKVGEGTIIEITSNTSKTIEDIVEIPFEVETISNPQLDEGVQNILSEGINGQKKTVVEIKYMSGKEVSRETILEEVTQPPVNKVVEVGTAKTIKGVDGVYQFERELTMSATAYTANYECTGKSPGDANFGVTASGIKAKSGVVAVDPKVIPLGTELYIEGYGYAIAGDTGSAIKGNKIDLYFDSYSHCLQFGRQNVTVYILK